MLKLNTMKTKLWYLKNLDMFSHLRNEEMHHVIEKTSSMKEIKKGDVLYLVDSPEGLTLTPYQQDFDQQMEAAEKVLKKYRNALHELAK